ncbi:hypothetical protein SAMN05216524_1092 [Mucilaginibacter sp. OK098]|nr:hypothetical protein SAMN05216524_1092 [Mucilaginibacter sp. OK098]
MHISVKAQSGSQTQYFVPQPFPRSPTATALEKYGTYQVNEFTGVPDISIPLYTVEAGGFQVPITLSYHASGIKVTDVASWAGLGWSVSSGGQVTRKTMGLPDDVAYGYLNGYMWQPGTFSANTIANVDYLENVATGIYDSRPDIYSYDFPGHGGKFFFDGSVGKNYAVRMLPFSPLKISKTGSISKFNIADEHGNNYSFGDTGGTESTYSTLGGALTNWIASAWKINSMISQNRRDTISFTYQQDQIDYPSADNEVYTVIDGINNIAPGVYSNASYSLAPNNTGITNITNELLPQQINFKNGKVVFELDAARRADVDGVGGNHAYGLNDIKIYRYNYGTKTMELQKTIVFYKSYFNPTSARRLRLDSIQVLDKAGSIMQHYRFDYNTSISLPDYPSYLQDYWGYYNNGYDINTGLHNTMLTPRQTISYSANGLGSTNVTIGQANRNPDSTYMQAFVLTGIHYPSGGYSAFTYQTNQYTDAGTLYQAGGLRIKTISSYDGVNPTPTVKTYVYNSARKNFLLDYAYFSTSQTHRHFSPSRGTANPLLDGSETVRSYSSNPHCDLEAYDGATVVYPSVTEYIGTPGTNIGRTDYTFTDQRDAISDASMAGNLVYLSSFYVRGHLLSKKEYIHKTDGSYQPVKLTTNSYTAFPYTNYDDVGLAVRKQNYNEGSAGNPIEPGTASPDDANSYTPIYYYITSDDNYLTGTTTKLYDMNDTTKATLSTVSYKYDNIAHQQVTRTYHTDSKGNTLITRSKYPADYLAGNAVIDSMKTRNMQAEAIEKYDTLKNVTTSVNAIISGQLNQFKTGNLTGSIVPATVSILNIPAPVTDFVASGVSGVSLTKDARYTQMISFDNYDPQNNIVQYTPRNSTPVSLLWDYNYELPVAQIKNATSISQVAYTSFEAPRNGGWYYAGAPVTDPTAPTGNMVYALNLGAVTSPAMDAAKAYVLSLWSNNGAPTVTAGSSLSGTPLRTSNNWTYYEYQVPVGNSSVTVSGTAAIDELRLYPAAAQMTTYAYNPSGIINIADTKGSISHFDYDAFSRLRNVKDWAGNIVKNYGYHMYDQVVGNAAIGATSFTRNNCPAGTSPTSTTYSVPANRYYGATTADANAEAMYDLNTKGQIKANTVCSCPVQNISVTLTNNTGNAGYQATFTGIATPYNFPATGSTVVSVPAGTYATVSINPFGSFTATFTMGTRTPISGHSASFSTVIIATGSSDLTLSIN